MGVLQYGGLWAVAIDLADDWIRMNTKYTQDASFVFTVQTRPTYIRRAAMLATGLYALLLM